MWQMSDSGGFVNVGTVNAEVFDFLFLLLIKSVEEISKAMTILTSHHFQWLTSCSIESDGYKTLTGTKDFFVYQYTLYIFQLRLRYIYHFQALPCLSEEC